MTDPNRRLLLLDEEDCVASDDWHLYLYGRDPEWPVVSGHWDCPQTIRGAASLRNVLLGGECQRVDRTNMFL
jgi:hypothetical protein